MRPLFALCVSILLSACLIGCSNGDAFGPDRPKPLDAPSKQDAAVIEERLTDYVSQYVNTTDTTARTTLRDKVIVEMLPLIDSRYDTFEHQLYAGRAVGDLMFDLTNLGLAGAGTISNGERAKTVLAALVTAVTGAKLAVSKNLYNEQATLAIIAKMQELRSAQKLAIMERLSKQNDDEYPLIPAAMDDLRTYYKAGTVIQALTSITGEANEQKGENEKSIKALPFSRTMGTTEKRMIAPATVPTRREQ